MSGCTTLARADNEDQRLAGLSDSDLPDSDLSELVTAARSGSPNAWRELHARFQRLVLSGAYRYGLSAAESDDVAQFTWLRLVENIETIREPRALAGWLGTTSAREAMAVARRRAREVPQPEPVGLCTADEGVDTDDVVDIIDLRLELAYVMRCMRRLPERERRILEVLFGPQELSYAQASRQLGMPVGSIGPVRQRAINRLRHMLAADGRYVPDRQSTAIP